MNRLTIFFKRHANTILTIVSSFGVVSTATLSGMATYEAIKAINKKEAKTKKEKFKVAAPIYIPTILSGVSTIACIISTNVLNRLQQASMASAYALLSNSYREYRNKLKEIHGEEADLEVISNIASEKFPEKEIPEGLELFYDQFSKRYFTMSMEDMVLAVYNFNRLFAFKGVASINEFYDFLQIPHIDCGDAIGWSSWEMSESGLIPWIDVHTFQAVTCEGKTYFIVDFDWDPIEGYEDY